MKNFTLKTFVLAFAFLAVASFALAQMPAAITIEPEGASAYDEITLTFNANESCTPEGKDDLIGFDQIYMHSAAFQLGQSGGWGDFAVDYNATGANGQQPILTANGDETYSITYTPAAFYGFPEGTIITKLTAVFNGGTWDAEGKDFGEGSECVDFQIPLYYESGEPVLSFTVNMSKMINAEEYDPLDNDVYLKLEGFEPMVMEDQLNGTATVFVEEGLEVDQTYTYFFSIDNTTDEEVTREVTTVGGTVSVEVWWNDDPMGQITFIVDMTYQVELGTFDPSVDIVDVPGSMNGWGGSGAMDDIGENKYSVTIPVEPGVVEYKFRINEDWDNAEFPGGSNRMTWATQSPITLSHVYNDYNPATWPVTFNVDMNTEITEGRFVAGTDYLDIAGTMNGWGGHSVLFDRDWTADGVYTIYMLIDTAAPNPNMEFKFRINGDWGNSEFPAGGPNRHWVAQDTAGGVTNLYECVYNILDVAMAPYVYDVAIEGDVEPDIEITGAYTYFDPNGDPEGASMYQWYNSPNADGSEKVAIEGATALAYTVTEDDRDLFLVFEVTPVADSPVPNTGDPKAVVSYQVGHTGLGEAYLEDIAIYPNPVYSELFFDNTSEITRIDIHNLIGQIIYSQDVVNTQNFSVNTDNWNPGMYFVVIRGIENTTRTVKVIKK